MSTVTATDDDKTEPEYRIPNNEIWRVRSHPDENKAYIAPDAFTANRGRAKELDKFLYINGEKVAKIASTGRAEMTIEYTRQLDSYNTDLKTAIEKRGDASIDDVEEGYPLYKTAEDDEGLYFLTSKPDGFAHESADPDEDFDEAPTPVHECQVCGREFDSAQALGGHKTVHDDEPAEADSDPRTFEVDATSPVRLPPHATLDDIEWGRMYDAEVNNREDYGVFVSLPETPPKEAVSVLIHKEKSDLNRPDLLDKLKTASERKDGRGDRLLVAPKHRRVSDGKWTFTIVKAIDTFANVVFDNDIPDEKVYVDQHNEPLDDPLIGERMLGIAPDDDAEDTDTDTDAEADAEADADTDAEADEDDAPQAFSMSASPHEPQGERPSDALEAEAMQQSQQEDDEEDDEPDAQTALQRAYSEREEPAEEYTDAGEMAENTGATLTEVAEPDLTEHYADTETLARHSAAFIQVLKQVNGDDAEAAKFIRWRLSQLDEQASREFIGAAAGSDIPDDVFRKLARELL